MFIPRESACIVLHKHFLGFSLIQVTITYCLPTSIHLFTSTTSIHVLFILAILCPINSTTSSILYPQLHPLSCTLYPKYFHYLPSPQASNVIISVMLSSLLPSNSYSSSITFPIREQFFFFLFMNLKYYDSLYKVYPLQKFCK